MRQLSRVHIPGASGAGPLTPFVPCTLSLFRPIVHPDICQVGPAGDRPLYAIYAGGHVTDNVPGRVNRLLARAGVGNGWSIKFPKWGLDRLLARAGVGNAQICSTEFCGTNRLLARVGAGGQPQISEGTRRLPGEVLQGSRSGVGLVPVAVNDYSPQKGGAEVVPGR